MRCVISAYFSVSCSSARNAHNTILSFTPSNKENETKARKDNFIANAVVHSMPLSFPYELCTNVVYEYVRYCTRWLTLVRTVFRKDVDFYDHDATDDDSVDAAWEKLLAVVVFIRALVHPFPVSGFLLVSCTLTMPAPPMSLQPITSYCTWSATQTTSVNIEYVWWSKTTVQ